jgi:hypothetical protein
MRSKRPATKNGFKAATVEAAQIREWWTSLPDSNIGLPMGAASGLLLLDLDYRNGAMIGNRSALLEQYGPIPETAEVITGSGSRHIYFRHPGCRVPKQIAKGIELKGEGGYSVAPPSIHPNGNEYSFDGAQGVKALLRVADPPAWLLDAIRTGTSAKKQAAAADERWPEGERNNRLTSMAGSLRRAGLSVESIETALIAENRRRCDPPLSEAEVRRIAESVGRYPAGDSISERAPSPAQVELGALPVSIDTLNALTIFAGRIAFTQAKRHGPMILLTTTHRREIVFPNTAALGSFTTAQACISDGSGIHLPAPPSRFVRSTWDPATGLILRIAEADAISVQPALREETRDLLQLMFRASGQPVAHTSADFIAFMRMLLQSRRDPRGEHDPPPAVFIREESCWAHVPSLRSWLSTPQLTNKLYPLADIRNGLLLLGFAYFENLTRNAEGEKETMCLWRGPLDVLIND